MVTVITIPTAQIIKVLQTSAKDRDKGFILLEIVTAIGTEIEIDMIRQSTNIQTNMFYAICSKNTPKLST